MNMNKIFLFVPAFWVVFLSFTLQQNQRSTINQPQVQGQNLPSGESKILLPDGFNDLFAGSGVCAFCHNSMVNLQGEPVGIANDWRSTMMANSAKDPFWQAKVSHEGLINPEHKNALEDVCTRCHAPAGNFNAHHNGQQYYTLDEMKQDSLALDGVQCTVCHQITEASLGNFSGTMQIGTEKTIWGPFENPFANPMFFNSGYTPVHSGHINDSRLCGSCHTLFTNSVDLNGNFTGETFPEQTIYQEWKNSQFSQSSTSCQSCHVPRIPDPVKKSSRPWWLEPRAPFAQHHHAGANIFMGRLIKENAQELGVTASSTHFDSTINRSMRMLQNETLDISLREINRTNDTLFIELKLYNKAGHKFPTGFPSRRAFIELTATSENGQKIFHSGEMDENFNLLNEADDFETHQQIIYSEEQVQIYEMVMGDVNGDVTTVLERGYEKLKDNRIPPAGFIKNHYNYDTVSFSGNAANDPDFNIENGIEGSGSDRLYFHIPLQKYYGNLSVTAKVHYQTLSNKWLAEMFAHSSTEIETFKTMYENADKTPTVVAEKSILVASGYEIPFSEGWNGFSAFILPEESDIEIVLEEIWNELIILIGEEGIVFPQGGIYTLNNFDPYQGYSIKLANPGKITLRGTTLTNRSKNLAAAWNILPVLAGCETDINSLNSSFLTQTEIILETAGLKVYWPEQDVFTLTTLQPGKTYLVKLKQASNIDFPACW
jgi:hypothetical protein